MTQDMKWATPAVLSENLVHFVQALRRAGLRIGSAQIHLAAEAMAEPGLMARREDLGAALGACFLRTPEDRVVFDEIFRLFWRDPRLADHRLAALLPSIGGTNPPPQQRAGQRRALEALRARDGTRDANQALQDDRRRTGDDEEEEGAEQGLALRYSHSARERLRQLDFDQMSREETEEARRIIAGLRLPVPPLPGRRFSPQFGASAGARPDPRRILRDAVARGGDIAALARRAPRPRPPNLVMICDISGSMSQYSRMMLHLLHALCAARVTTAQAQGGRGKTGWGAVHGFTFGTRLTNITRHMHARDVDAALARAGRETEDWQGGTRIGACLGQFNRLWAPRVLGQGAVVLLVSDGLDRDAGGDGDRLGREMERLQRRARQLIWLNPLLRWEGFTPQAQGIRAMLPHVDSFRASHNIASLSALAEALSRGDDPGEKQRLLAELRRGEVAEAERAERNAGRGLRI